ncbi:hypothetical protein OG749_05080 [Streptomyces nojiriensis]|uniref:hypothetical protein n=1 Tax=Streptomyces nojiriensis TaxID=66374 RepID=UPI002E188F9F
MERILRVARSAWTKTFVVSLPQVSVTVAFVRPVPLPVEVTFHLSGTFWARSTPSAWLSSSHFLNSAWSGSER